ARTRASPADAALPRASRRAPLLRRPRRAPSPRSSPLRRPTARTERATREPTTGKRSRHLQNPELLAEREERRGERRAVRPLAHVRPVDLLADGPGHLDDALVVHLVLAHRGQLRDEHVFEGH